MSIEKFGRQLAPSLYVIQGRSQGSHFDLASLTSDDSDQAIGIGREKGNRIVVEDHEASRRHAEIRKHNDTFFLTDLNSSNGTFLNNSRISEAELKSGDRIQIGRTLFLYSKVRANTSHPPTSKLLEQNLVMTGHASLLRFLTNWGQIFHRFPKMTRRTTGLLRLKTTLM